MKILTNLITTACLLLAASASGVTWHLNPDGSGDAESIQVALDHAAPGDIVELAAGIYYEHDLAMPSGVVLRGSTGHHSGVIIDAQQQGRVILCDNLPESVQIDALTLTGGLVSGSYPDGYGGAIGSFTSDIVVSNCLITENQAAQGGGMGGPGGGQPGQGSIGPHPGVETEVGEQAIEKELPDGGEQGEPPGHG